MTKPPISAKPKAKSFSNTGFRRCAARLRAVTRTFAVFGVKNCDRGTSTAKTSRADQRRQRAHQQRDPPVADIDHQRRDDPPGAGHRRGPGDVASHRRTERRRVHLLGEERHRDRGYPGERDAVSARPTSRTLSVGLNGSSNPITLEATPDVSITVMRP